jgi:hypothetical protein
MMVSGNMPAFSVTLGSNQSITSNVNTKLQFNTEEFDTNNCFDSSTNYRFTPNVSGYYQITASVYPNSTTTFTQAGIYKNGSLYKRQFLNVSNNVCMVTAIVYFNGTTDYVECYGALTGVSPIVDSNSSLTYFQGSMVRGA